MPKQKDSMDQKIEYLDRLHRAMNRYKMHYAYVHNEGSIVGLRTITNGVRDEVIEMQALYNVYRRHIAQEVKIDMIKLMVEIEKELFTDCGGIDKEEIGKEIETLRYKIGAHLDRGQKDKKTNAGLRKGKKTPTDESGDRKGPFQ